ncbi:MAG: polysaccharide deacetylase family protein, partial [Thermoprotei archaeon]
MDDKPTLLVTVDVENWYNSRLFKQEAVRGLDGTKHLTNPLEDLNVVLDVFSKHGIKATFFVLGSLLEDYPEIPSLIEQAGHEVGMHAYHHKEFKQIAEFKQDLDRGLEAFRRVTGSKPRGYRHPYFMVNNQKLELLSQLYLYDASTVPSIHIPGHYGDPHAPTKPTLHKGLVRLPLSVTPYTRLPAATGWYYRNIGYRYIKWILDSSLLRYGYAQICLHTWEFTHKEKLRGIPFYVFKNCGQPMSELCARIAELAAGHKAR